MNSREAAKKAALDYIQAHTDATRSVFMAMTNEQVRIARNNIDTAIKTAFIAGFEMQNAIRKRGQ